jgi:hypothetical protein
LKSTESPSVMSSPVRSRLLATEDNAYSGWSLWRTQSHAATILDLGAGGKLN